jgi:MFS family permease
MSYPVDEFAPVPGAENGPEAAFRLAPLSTGQILDRTFVLYRSRFALFAGLAVFPAAVSLLFGLIQLIYLLATHAPLNGANSATFSTAYFVNMSIGLGGGLLRLCVYGISIAATTWCIARIYLGEAATMKAGFDFAFRKWFRYIVMVLAQAWFAMWLPLLVLVAAFAALFGIPGMAGVQTNSAGALFGVLIFLLFLAEIVWLVINFIRVSLAIPVCVVEETPIRASIRRSRKLLVSRKVRIFLLFLFVVALELVFSAVLLPLAVILGKQGQSGVMILQIVSLAITFLYGVLISPIAAIGLCLFYFDERVRREGFDIEFLMSRAAPAPEVLAPEAAAETTPGPQPEAPPEAEQAQ